MLVHRVNYVIGVREIVAGEILWPVFVSQGAELDDTVLSDALKLWLCVVRVTKILALQSMQFCLVGIGAAPASASPIVSVRGGVRPLIDLGEACG